MDRRLIVLGIIHTDSSRTPPPHSPAAVLTAFLAVSPLLKGVEAGAAKRTRLEYLGVRLGEAVQTPARCCNVTQREESSARRMMSATTIHPVLSVCFLLPLALAHQLT